MGLSPQFRLVSKPSLYRSISDGLSALWETDPPVNPVRLDGVVPWPRERSLLPALLTSLLINFAVIFFLYRVPFAWLLRAITGDAIEPEQHHYSVVIVNLQHLELPPYLPLEQPSQPGGSPGSSASAGMHAPHGSTAWDPRVSIVSNPKQPDNFHQTLLQRTVPPKVKLLEDVQLPDLVIPPAPGAPKPMPLAQITLAPPVASRPVALSVGVPPPPRPVPAAITPLPLAPLLALNGIIAPPAATPPPTQQQAASSSQQVVTAQGSAKLLSLSIRPAPLKNVLALPLGNRLGAFSVSPAGSHQGAPGGAPGSPGGSGTQGSGPGGDVSISAGPGGVGGGGASSSSAGGMYSVSGALGRVSESSGGSLSPLRAGALVYPVKQAEGPRKPALVVSTGPGGGGGLGVYGVLECGRIFTVYLSMSPRNWILEYCAPQSDPPPVSSSNIVEIRMEPPLAPPYPARQFDFHRPTLASDASSQMIILHGTIGKDGSVGALKLLRGVQANINQAAMAAFARWKFSPALRGGKPVAVEILVGIPSATE